MADAPLNYPPLPAELTPLERQAASERYWGKPDLRTAFENGAVWAEGRARSAMNAYWAGYVLADREARATPSPPVAAVPATPVAPPNLGAAPQNGWDAWTHAAQPQPQPAQPLTGATPLSDEQVQAMYKELMADPNYTTQSWFTVTVRFIERAHGITAPSTPTPPEVAP